VAHLVEEEGINFRKEGEEGGGNMVFGRIALSCNTWCNVTISFAQALRQIVLSF
jgi:hypothetical protein